MPLSPFNQQDLLWNKKNRTQAQRTKFAKEPQKLPSTNVFEGKCVVQQCRFHLKNISAEVRPILEKDLLGNGGEN